MTLAFADSLVNGGASDIIGSGHDQVFVVVNKEGLINSECMGLQSLITDSVYLAALQYLQEHIAQHADHVGWTLDRSMNIASYPHFTRALQVSGTQDSRPLLNEVFMQNHCTIQLSNAAFLLRTIKRGYRGAGHDTTFSHRDSVAYKTRSNSTAMSDRTEIFVN